VDASRGLTWAYDEDGGKVEIGVDAEKRQVVSIAFNRAADA